MNLVLKVDLIIVNMHLYTHNMKLLSQAVTKVVAAKTGTQKTLSVNSHRASALTLIHGFHLLH